MTELRGDLKMNNESRESDAVADGVTDEMLKAACAAFSRMQGRQSLPESQTYVQFQTAMRAALVAAMQAQQGAEPVAILSMNEKGDGLGSRVMFCRVTEAGHALPAGRYELCVATGAPR